MRIKEYEFKFFGTIYGGEEPTDENLKKFVRGMQSANGVKYALPINIGVRMILEDYEGREIMQGQIRGRAEWDWYYVENLDEPEEPEE